MPVDITLIIFEILFIPCSHLSFSFPQVIPGKENPEEKESVNVKGVELWTDYSVLFCQTTKCWQPEEDADTFLLR